MSAGPPLASHDLAPLLTTDRPIPARPVLLVGPASAAILGADGSFSLPWDTRGAPIDWGGVYAQGVRLTGPWSVGVGPAGRETPLGPGTLRSLSAWRWRSLATHRVSGIEVLDELLALADASGVGRRLSLR
ncbi:MAG TPA: hypothetical protein VJQ43_03425, partial [Thermoplasmata archaeon]|nr:hypothetical protein [Thermoplasmata archaeon]